MKRSLIILSLLIFFYSIPISAHNDQLEERLILLSASQELAKREEVIGENKLGVFVTDFGSNEGELSVGGSLEIALFNQQTARGISEIIYLKEEEVWAGFLSLKFLYPLEENLSFYFGAGGEVTGRAKYQLFTGLNLSEDFFIEGKYTLKY